MIVTAATLWIAAGVRLLRWMQHPRLTPAVGTILVLVALAALTTTNTPLVGRLAADVRALSAVQQVLILVACVGAEVVVTGIASPTRAARAIKRLSIAASGGGAVVLVLFALGPRVPAGLTVYEFASRYSGDPYFGAAFLVVQLYAGVACGRVAYFASRIVRQHSHLWIPMLLLAAGAATFTTYAALRAAVIVTAIFGDVEPRLSAVFDAMSYLGAAGAAFLVASFCWVPIARTLRSLGQLRRQRPIYHQVVSTDSALAAPPTVGGLSLSRRADARATAVLDFLTLLMPDAPAGSLPTAPDPQAVAQWLATPAAAPRRPPIALSMLAIPTGHRPAEWLDQVLRELPAGRSALLDDLQDSP